MRQYTSAAPMGYCLVLVFLAALQPAASGAVAIDYDSDIPRMEFAAEHLRSALDTAESLHGPDESAGPI
ncbi:MAG: hypothetical protein ACLFV4_10105, partial [Candidatus Hydrogenedentota bacterium]